MKYDSESDVYTCANKRFIKVTYLKRKQIKMDTYEVQVYKCESYNNCFLRGKCFKGKNNKKIECSKVLTKLRKRSQDNIKNKVGILLRMNHSIQVERTFSVTKQDYKCKNLILSIGVSI